MKTTAISVLGAILFLVFAGCTREDQHKRLTVLTGEIRNNATSEVRIENSDTIFTGRVDPRGRFKISFPLSKDDEFQYVGNEFTSIYLSPGDSLHLDVDARDWRSFDSTLRFSGTSGPLNNYYFSKGLLVYDLLVTRKSKMLEMSENDFLKELDSSILVLLDHFEEFRSLHPRQSSRSIDLELDGIEYLRRSYCIDYCTYRLKNTVDPDNLVMKPEDYIMYDDISKEGFAHLKEFQEYMVSILNHLIHQQRIREEKEKITFVMRKLDEMEIHADLKEVLTGAFQEQYARLNDPDDSLLPGSPAPDFRLFNEDGEKYCLGDFRGKYLYIDVWATYCSPCIREIPAFEQLKAEYSGEMIVFASVSVDRKEKAWSDAIDKHGMTELQLRPENDWSSAFVKDYRLNMYGIPHYVLIGPDGRILIPDAPKPSEIGNELQIILTSSGK